MNILIKGAHVVDPKHRLNKVCDVLIEKGTIVEIADTISEKKNCDVINAEGLHLFPGLFDLHVHFREPGYEYKETIKTAAEAALRGGYVGAVSMPNSKPFADSPGVIELILKRSREAKFPIFPCGCITVGSEGTQLTEMAELRAAGCVAVSDDGGCIQDSAVMRRAMEYASMFGLIVMTHPEDVSLSRYGCMHEGFVSTQLGLRGIPETAENVMIARDIELARLTGAHLHLQHVSTKRGADMIADAKKQGLPITAEVTPHHIALTEEDIDSSYNTNMKMNPPLRTKKDKGALILALKKKTIDVIATDHAPHQKREKDGSFDEAPFGTVGLETALPVALTQLYHTEIMSLSDIVDRMSTCPQKILGIEDFAEVKKGITANLTLVDVNKKWVVKSDALHSKSKNSCFTGKQLIGKVVATISQGTLYKY